jgi:hypothetical protein
MSETTGMSGERRRRIEGRAPGMCEALLLTGPDPDLPTTAHGSNHD